jgi:KUP system potassium uptake protein
MPTAPARKIESPPSVPSRPPDHGEAGHSAHGTGWRSIAALSVGALGVVYGDIGTSPLYALHECFAGEHGAKVTALNILGALSLVFWALIIVVSLKYVVLVMRADNRGEGGILALMALVGTRPERSDRRKYVLVLLGLFGAALLYGDGMITPAISVLSAIEGLGVVTTQFNPYIVPITVTLLVLLFLVQSAGTGRMGVVFGPIMVVWFLCLGALGIAGISHHPGVLAALSPTYAIDYFRREGAHGLFILGGVFLALTGGEALYADMGHFGRFPIRLTWFLLALPTLVLNYLGQGALLLEDPTATDNLFYRMAPSWAVVPLVILAAAATIIASQALISASFSLTHQAVQLGYSPRVQIIHTSSKEIGQIYVPGVNWLLMVACIGLVLGFKSSSNLASAYGLAVTGTMAITTILFFVVTRELWRWSLAKSLVVATPLLMIDLSFLGANLLKFLDGGWFPLLIGTGVFTLMTTWKRGRELLGARYRETATTMDAFCAGIEQRKIARVPGLAFFLTGNVNSAPYALLENIQHNKVLHERNVLLTVITEEVSRIPEQERLTIEPLQHGFWRMTIRFGFAEHQYLLPILELAKTRGFEFELKDATFFLSRETVLATDRPGMAIWRENLFASMALNARSAVAHFALPPERVVEMGLQVEI